MCEQKVQNSDSLILIHLYGHAEVMPYRCKMCGASECQLERMYAHIRQGHPNKVNLLTITKKNFILENLKSYSYFGEKIYSQNNL